MVTHASIQDDWPLYSAKQLVVLPEVCPPLMSPRIAHKCRMVLAEVSSPQMSPRILHKCKMKLRIAMTSPPSTAEELHDWSTWSPTQKSGRSKIFSQENPRTPSKTCHKSVHWGEAIDSKVDMPANITELNEGNTRPPKERSSTRADVKEAPAVGIDLTPDDRKGRVGRLCSLTHAQLAKLGSRSTTRDSSR